MTAAFQSTEFIDSGVTIPLEVSPRKLDLVGIAEIAQVLAERGKVNQETGEPLSEPRIVALVARSDFPPPAVDGRTGRLWRRPEVVKWAQGWDQRSGRPKQNG